MGLILDTVRSTIIISLILPNDVCMAIIEEVLLFCIPAIQVLPSIFYIILQVFILPA